MSETQTPKGKRRVTGPGARESAGSRLSAGIVSGDGMRVEWQCKMTAEGLKVVASCEMEPGYVMAMPKGKHVLLVGARHEEIDGRRFWVEDCGGTPQPRPAAGRDSHDFYGGKLGVAYREALLLMAPLHPLEREINRRIDQWSKKADEAMAVFYRSGDETEIRAMSRLHTRCWSRINSYFREWRGLVERGAFQ